MRRHNFEEVKGRRSPFSSEKITCMQCYDGMRKCTSLLRISLQILFQLHFSDVYKIK
jgi:hypothetical protein